VLRVLGEEGQVRSDGASDPIERVGRAFLRRANGLLQLSHPVIDAGEKQFLFAGEVQIDRSLGNPQTRRDAIHVAVGIAQLSEQTGGRFDDLLSALGTQFARLSTSDFASGFHSS
jgi:hypothetical protein